jgi:hypothetical protein
VKLSPESLSAKRTAVNVTVVGYVIAVISRITGWEINVTPEDMVWLVPVIGFLMGVGYRLSRWATNKWPTLGWFLFGSGKEPAGVQKIGTHPEV